MLDTDGTAQWGSSDVRVNQYVDDPKQEFPAVAEDSDGCAIVVWDDERTDDDIYAQKLFCEDVGRAYIFYGKASWSSSYSASSADVKIDGENNGDQFGSSVSRAGNVDGSNYNDTIVGAPTYNSVGNMIFYDIGRAYVFYGDGSIPTSAGSADKTYTGGNVADMFGFSVSYAGDVDNDGKDEVIIGAPYNDDSGTNAGEAYIYYGGDQYVYVDSKTETYGYTSNFNNAKSASDSGAYSTLTEESVSWYDSGGSEVTIDGTLDNTDTEYNPSPSGVFISDTVGYVFYIEKWSSNNRQVSYRKTTNGGTSWGSPVSISTDLDWRNVAIWYDKWTPGGTGDKIHIAAVNDDNPDVQYRWLNTTDSDSLRSSWVSIFDVGSWGVPNGGPSIVNSTDGILYVSGFGGTTSGVYRSTNNGTSWTGITPSYYFDEGDDHAQLLPLSGGDILCIYHDTTTITTDWGRWFVWDEETDAWNSSANQLAVWTGNSNYPAVFGASLYKTTGDVYLAANMDPGDATNNLKSYFFDESVRAFTTKTDVYNNIGADGTDVKIFVNEDNGDVFGVYGRGGASAQIYYKKSTDGMETWGDETQVSTNADDHRIVRPNFMSDERVYAFWYNDDTDALLGNSACDIKADYKMDIEFNTANVPTGTYTLQLNYSVDGTETAFGVLVYDGSSWDDQTAQGDLSQTSFTEKSYTLDSDHRLSSGNVRVRFIGRNESSDSVNSTLKIEYHRIKVTGSYLTLSGEYAGHRFGWSVANASDVNNDGSFDDVIVGAPYYRSEPYSAVWSSSDVMVHQNPDSADQGSSDIATDANGNVFIAWQDERNGASSDDIFAQKFDPAGNSQWGPSDLKVHTDSALVQYGPSVAIDPNGNLIVVWSDERHGSTNDSIYAQKLDTNGNKLWDTSDVRVNQYTTSCTMIVSDIAIDSDGNAIIVWRDNRNSDYDIYAQKLDPNGIVQWGASDVKVNQYSSSENEFGPTLALDPLGYAIVVWQDGRNGVTTNDTIYAQMLDEDGDALWGSSDVRVHQDDGTYRRSSPKIAADSDGNSVVVWTDERNGGSDARIYGQRLSRYGVVQWSADVQVNQDTTDETGGAAIAVDSNGHFFVAWQDQSGNSDIYAQKLDLDGNVHWGSSDLRLNQGDGDFHTAVRLTVDNNDNLIALFVNTTGDDNVLMQKFQATDITGRAYIFNGASGMDATADVSLTGENDGDMFGFSVHGASDIGGDGVPDVIVGAPYYDDGATADVGNVYLYYGGSSMDSNEDYIHLGTQANMHFGWSVSLALSMDGGSYKQVVVGGPHYDDGSDEDAGTAEVLNIYVIPEFSTVVIPIFVIILFVIMWRRRKKDI